ncbi:hypothetical protein [Acidovorax sp.]
MQRVCLTEEGLQPDNCPLYNAVVAVGWQPGVFYSPFVWYYFLTP